MGGYPRGWIPNETGTRQMSTGTRLGIRAYARHREERGLSGGTPAAIRKALKAGRIQAVDGMIDPEEADAAWGDNTNVAKVRPKSERTIVPSETVEIPPAATRDPEAESGTASARAVEIEGGAGVDGSTFMDHKARRELAEAQMAELELRKMVGELVLAKDVERETFNVFRTLRDRLMVIADRLAPVVAAESDAAKVHAQITAELRIALTDVSTALPV